MGDAPFTPTHYFGTDKVQAIGETSPDGVRYVRYVDGAEKPVHIGFLTPFEKVLANAPGLIIDDGHPESCDCVYCEDDNPEAEHDGGHDGCQACAMDDAFRAELARHNIRLDNARKTLTDAVAAVLSMGGPEVPYRVRRELEKALVQVSHDLSH